MSEEFRFETQRDYINYSKKMHGYSKAVSKLLDLVTGYIQWAEDQARLGKRVSYTAGSWDAPLFYGCNTIPIAFTELGRLGSRQAITLAENQFLTPKESCSMVNSMLGEWYMRKDGPIKKVLLTTGICEAIVMAGELIKKEGYKLHFIEDIFLPKWLSEDEQEERIRFFTRELRDAAKFLLDGKEPDETKISEEIKRLNRIIDKVHHIIDLRRDKPLYIKSLPTMYLLCGLGHLYGRPEVFEDVVTELEEELLHDNPEFDNNKNVIPVVWVGARGQEFGVYHAVDICGGAIVGWIAVNNYTRKYPEDVPPLESITRYLFGNTQSRNLPIIHRNQAIEREVQKVNAKGVILYGYVGCALQGVQTELQRAYLKERGITSLGIEGTFQVGQPSGQLLTRVSAFMEMLA
ncbi:2-hydroxyacyl-CoA dehydratase family protein [Treponema primitia]|uniref:2-hydroxyacyl-CoA dehydratase n=1 Tax=Treponema primitia TaxID=88058 RepID=UPI00397FFBFE